MPRADNRGDLVFELRSHRDREFVIYRISGGQAEQVFTTGSLPNSNTKLTSERSIGKADRLENTGSVAHAQLREWATWSCPSHHPGP